MGPSSRAIHVDRRRRPRRSVVPPIFQSVNFEAASDGEFAILSQAESGQHLYVRDGNPNHDDVAAIVANLEGGEDGLAVASGMAGLTAVALTFLTSGSKAVIQHSTYAGTNQLFTELLPRFGVETVQVDQGDVSQIQAAVDDKTRLIVVETPSNPLLQLTDLSAVASIAAEVGAITIADNTFATPINQQPLTRGIDLAWHSATKYLGGHSDVSAGVIVGRRELIRPIRTTAIQTGPVLGPVDAWLLLRGLRTLPLRVQRHNENALAIAQSIFGHPRIKRVHYPGLHTHPQHALAADQMTGFGGMLSIEFDQITAARAFIDYLQLPRIATSLGSVESLVVRPASMWADSLDPQRQARAGVTPGLVRLSTGIEDTADLVEDIEQALAALPDRTDL